MHPEWIYRRHSVRKFKPDLIPEGHIREMIQAATHAPSGKNRQNWHFVVVLNPDKINQIADIVVEKNAKISTCMAKEEEIRAFRGLVPYHTVFRDAPALILIYAGPYDTIVPSLLAAGIMPAEEAVAFDKPNPGVQNIAAAMENLQLTAADMGYGTCWMTGPTYADKEISKYLNFYKEGYFLAALTPLGIPASDKLSSPPRKPLEEVLTIIDE